MKTAYIPALVASLAIGLSACGSVEEPQTEAAANEPGKPVSVTDARGEAISLDAPATEVVGLEWGVVENLVSLGVMPVGVADVKGYTNWVSAAPLDDGVTDVGMRGEPSVDSLVALDPDLVITTSDLPANIVEQIEEFVPVLVVRGADAAQPIEQMRENLNLVAEVVDRTDEADALLEDLDAALAEGAEAVEAADATGKGFVLADGWIDGSTVSIRMFTPGSLAGAIGEEIGLENTWTGEGDPDYGLAQTDVEGLTVLTDVEFLYYANDASDGDPFEKGLSGNAIWTSLPFVANGDVHRLPDGIWMFGGPLSAEQLIDATVEAVTS